MKRFFIIAAGVALTTAAIADVGAIKARQELYKGMNDATKPVAAMLRGQAPFDLAPVQAALKNYSDAAKKLPDLFPDDSKTGDKTEALPKIWDEKALFIARFKKFEGDADTALATIKDEASFKAEMPKVLGNCKGCHDEYRAKKS